MKGKMEVKWKAGFRVSADPEKAWEVLEGVRKNNNGEISPEAVVKASKPKRAPLHNEFEWDDQAAGERYRVFQARRIIGSIEVIRSEAPNVQSRAYEITKAKPTQEGAQPKNVYMRTEDILQDPVARVDLVALFFRDILALRRRYAALSELAQVWQAVDSSREEIEKQAV